jgi:putative addiction module CopG family antidote
MDLRLSPTAQDIISREMALGFDDPSQVIEQALQMFHTTRQQKIEHLQAALQEGKQSGASVPFDMDEIAAEADAEFDAGVSR